MTSNLFDEIFKPEVKILYCFRLNFLKHLKVMTEETQKRIQVQIGRAAGRRDRVA